MTKVFIIHGTGGHPNENWIPWLRKNLERLECTVIVPKFPTPLGQNLDNWLEVFEKHKNDLDSNTILVGHSVGVAFLLNVLERTDKKVKAAYLVSGFTGTLNNPTFDLVVGSFANRGFNWNKIKTSCSKFYIFHSDNDPFVNITKANELAERLGTTPVIVKGAGHFTIVRGYDKFEVLLENIMKELESKK